MLNNIKIATRTSIVITLVLVIGFFGLWRAVDKKSSTMVDKLIEDQMTDVVESRAYIINNYVQEAEQYMIAFAKSDEVRNLLKNPNNAQYLARAQQYTVEFAAVKGVFEGLYIAGYDTCVYTHTTEAVVGIHTREGDSLKELQNTILAEEKLTNLGIMKSPSSGNMVISMYYPVFEDGKCIGFVGSAVYASKLMESIVSLEVNGLSDSEYVFLNAATGEYLYNEDPELLCTVTEDEGYLKLLEEINAGKCEDVGLYEYTDDKGVRQVVLYKNIAERGWVFALKDTKDNVYSSVKDLKRTTALVCVVVAVVIILILILILSSLGRQLNKISGSLKKLGDMDLTANEDLAAYSGRGDEVGIICDALDKTCSNLKMYIGAVDEQLSAMAKGDFTKLNRVEFAGEFVKLQRSMQMIQDALRQSFAEINTVTSELVIGSQSVSDSSTQLANAATKANILVVEIEDYVIEISKQLEASADFAVHAKEQADDAAKLVNISRDKMEELSGALSHIAEATKAIEGISNNLEGIAKQTNILALNALVEANRAGDAGRGFGVVANEIRILAEQSSDAALNAYELIKQTIDSVNEGMRLGQEATECLAKVVDQTNTIDESVSRISDASGMQNDKLHGISNKLRDISLTVETTAAMAEQSAAASIELDGQTNVLKENIGNYRI